MSAPIRYLLLQVRNPDDPMREHEIGCFARVLGVPEERVGIFDLLGPALEAREAARADVFLLGGSGDYSVTHEGAWLDRALDSLRFVHDTGKPTFASCWGFQAMARAKGGRVIQDRSIAEIGTHDLFLTDAGKRDPVFSYLGASFKGQMGHEDHVVELPAGTTLLASSHQVANQAYRFDDAPVYCTQFHPELNGQDVLRRFAAYPKYVAEVGQMTLDQFATTLRDASESESLVRRFVEHMLGRV